MRYDFNCKNCNTTSEFELSMSFDKYDELECPSCGEKELKKVFSVPNIGGKGNSSLGSGCSTGSCCFNGNCG